MNIVKKLVDEHGMAKYRIGKMIGASWNTVQNWYREIYIPTKKNEKKLKELLKKKEEKK